MDSLIIVGAGGLGRAIYSVGETDPAHNVHWHLAGYLDSRPLDQIEQRIRPQILGSPLDFKPRNTDIFVLAVGDTRLKQQFSEVILSNGGQLIRFAPWTIVGTNSQVGTVVFNRNVTVGTDCTLLDHCFIDQGCVIGHDVFMDNYCHIGVNTFIAGGARIGKRVTIHGGAQIGKGVVIGDDAEIALGAVVLRDVKPGSLVIGNPAREIR
jgi:sugar O-acyltransferase (sialic acid O-acetyltransferase NeuD family)